MKPLYNKLVPWLLNGERLELLRLRELFGVVPLDRDEDMSKVQLVVWRDVWEVELGVHDVLLDFVANGGAVLCGAEPLKFLKHFKHRNLEEMDLNRFIRNFGVTFTDNVLITNKSSLNVDENVAHFSHLTDVMVGVSRGDAECDVLQGLVHLPREKEKVVGNILSAINRDAMTSADGRKVKFCNASKTSILIDEFLRQRKFFDGVPCGLDLFPGMPTQESTQTMALIDLMIDRPGYYPIGFYACPNQEIRINVDSVPLGCECTVLIGCHTSNLVQCQEWLRWPRISTEVRLELPTTVVRTIYGGGIYLRLLRHTELRVLTVQIFGSLCHSPCMYSESAKSMAKWNSIRSSPAPWADLAGQYIILTIPSVWVRDLETYEVAMLLHHWDSVVESNYQMKWYETVQARKNLDTASREWVLFDLQRNNRPAAMGQPVVLALPAHSTMKCLPDECPSRILDVDWLQTRGDWTIYRGLGLNMVDEGLAFCRDEILAAVFALHAIEKTTDEFATENYHLTQLYPVIKKFLSGPCGYSYWFTDRVVSVGFIAHAIMHFGYQAFQALFAKFRETPQNKLPVTDDEKISYWVLQFSLMKGQNMQNFFEFWGIPVRDCKLNPTDFPQFLPDDEISQLPSNTIATVWSLRRSSNADKRSSLLKQLRSSVS